MKSQPKSPKSKFVCQKCSYESGKWLGKCPNCNAWNSFEESTIQLGNIVGTTVRSNTNPFIDNQVLSLEALWDSNVFDTSQIYNFSSQELDVFWGGGLKSGSLTLLAGEPGLGKSTFALQILRALHNGVKANSKNKKDSKDANQEALLDKEISLLYITAEESVSELARRSKRLDIAKQILMLQSSNFEQIEKTLYDVKPSVVVIDSIQTLFSSQINSNPGSVSQVSTLTNQFLSIAKSQNIAIILIGHVTKEGQIAGPRTLEHMVDSVLMIERAESTAYRTLSFIKHRFGTTDNLLLLKMEEKGLSIVSDPSLALLENLESGIGICYSVGMDKNMPFVVEIQTLVSTPVNNGFGRREVIGIKPAKLNIILAIAEKYLNLDLKDRDVYLQITGSPKSLNDDSLDLAILIAILSSVKNKDVKDLFKVSIEDKKISYKQVFCGRLTFSGNLRTPTSIEARENIAKKLGFKFNFGITNGKLTEALSKINT